MFKLNTLKLQEMLSKAVKGASCNKNIPLTELMAIQMKDHKLTLITTDATNYLYVTEDKVDGDDFYVVVTIDLFSKLISRVTSEFVEFELKDDNLYVKGNGEYVFELPLDEEGRLVKFPDPLADVELKDVFANVKLSTITTILEVNKPSLPADDKTPCFAGYYTSDRVVTTNGYKMCGTKIPMFDKPVLISIDMMDMLSVLSQEDIEVYKHDYTVVFKTDNCIIYGESLDCVDEYPIDAINGMLDTEFEHRCKVDKNEILRVLDRLSLFVGKYDKKAIKLLFTKDGISISSKQSTGKELISYIESENFTEYACQIDIEMFQAQIKSHAVDSIEIMYGHDRFIKISEGNVVQIIGLISD